MRTLLAQFSGLAPFRANFTYNPNAVNQSPDGIANYPPRNTPTVQTGANSANVIDLNDPASVGRGVGVVGMDGKQPSLRIHEWNRRWKQLAKSTVVRLTYKGKHGVNADQLYNINGTQTDYVWFLTTGRCIAHRRIRSRHAPPLRSERLHRRAAAAAQRLHQFIDVGLRGGAPLPKRAGFSSLLHAHQLSAPGRQFLPRRCRQSRGLPPRLGANRFSRVKSLPLLRPRHRHPEHCIRWNWSYELPFEARARHSAAILAARSTDSSADGA